MLLGLEYSGFKDTLVSLEIVDRRLIDYGQGLESAPDYQKEDDLQGVLRVTRSFMNDRLELSVLASIYGLRGENGSFERLTLAYDLADGWQASGGVVLYQFGQKPMFTRIGANDRLFFELKYSF